LFHMRNVAHGTVYFSASDLERVQHLMLVQCSATRTAYQFMRRTGHVANEVKKYVKVNYMADLNQRYVSDACGVAAQIRSKPSVIFGGKRVWRDLQKGRLSKEQWQECRNSILYSRGDKTKNGNPNIRVEGDKLLINDPAERGRWIEGKLFIPKKFSFDPFCYDARLMLRKGKIEVLISSDTQSAPIITQSTEKGAIGIDCNPDGIALVETDADGNLLHHQYEREQRIRFSKSGKRIYDIRLLAVRVVDYALSVKKSLVLEKLRFWGGKQRGAKFNRMAANFLHRQLLDAIKSRAARMGVEILEVNPAFTSILGKLKYMDMYSLNNHAAAALVIARRGMGILEKQTFTDTLRGRGGSRVNLEGRSRKHTLKPKAWSWLENQFLRPKNNRAYSPDAGSCNIAGTGVNSGETPEGESSTITGRRGRSALPNVSGG